MTLWPHVAALAGCPTGYTPTDAAIDVVLSLVGRYLNPDPSHRRRHHAPTP